MLSVNIHKISDLSRYRPQYDSMVSVFFIFSVIYILRSDCLEHLNNLITERVTHFLTKTFNNNYMLNEKYCLKNYGNWNWYFQFDVWKSQTKSLSFINTFISYYDSKTWILTKKYNNKINSRPCISQLSQWSLKINYYNYLASTLALSSPTKGLTQRKRIEKLKM